MIIMMTLSLINLKYITIDELDLIRYVNTPLLLYHEIFLKYDSKAMTPLLVTSTDFSVWFISFTKGKEASSLQKVVNNNWDLLRFILNIINTTTVKNSKLNGFLNIKTLLPIIYLLPRNNETEERTNAGVNQFSDELYNLIIERPPTKVIITVTL